jgi:outer membrane receptor protein involved in Fe transport
MMRRTIPLCAGALLSSVLGFSQETGRIEGRVLRADGTAVPGVSVVVNELSLTEITDGNGAFTFSSVPVGTYSVTFVLGTNVVTTDQVQVAAGISYAVDKWDFAFDLRWVDDFRWAVGPFQGDVEAYTTADIRGNYYFNDRIGVGVNVANLFDNEHWESFGGDLLGSRALANVVVKW